MFYKVNICVLLCVLCQCFGFQDITIGQWLQSSKKYTQMSHVMTLSGLMRNLTAQDKGPFTLLVPTDAAFVAVPNATLEFIIQDSDALSTVLNFHIINGYLMDYAIYDGAKVTANNGQILNFSVKNGTKMVQNVTISARDIILNNGVVHVIDAVLVPPVMPPTENIAEILLRKINILTTLNTLLSITDLEPMLMAGTFTIFAPVDTAFDAIIDSFISFADPSAQTFYSNILLNHVVAGSYQKKDLTDGMRLTSESGKQLTVHLTGTSGNRVNDAPVSEWDILARNGVIHVISAVIV